MRAPLLRAMSLVLSTEFPSTMRISRSHLCFVKYSLLMASMVFPMPRSSLIVGMTILTFREAHSREKCKEKRFKKGLEKKGLKKKEMRRGCETPCCVYFRLRLRSRNATPNAAISVTSSKPGIPPPASTSTFAVPAVNPSFATDIE